MTSEPAPARLYTAWQITLASALGAPLGGAWLIAENYRRLNDKNGRRKALAWGVAATVAIVVAGLVLPQNFPSAVLPISSIVIMRQLGLRLFAAHPAPAASTGRAVLVGFVSLLAVCGTVGAAVLLTLSFAPTVVIDSVLDQVTISPGQAVGYADGATSDDARALGDALLQMHFFGGEKELDVRLSGQADRAISFVVAENMINDEGAAMFASLGTSLRQQLWPNQTLELRLCNDTWEPLRVVQIK